MTSSEFTRALARAMRRWHLLAIPTPIITTLMGDAGRELLLSSQQQIPAALLADGFTFRHETAEQAIDALVSPPRR
jgi:NAD dependent epimerase/dehydratase family enzyme